MIGSNGEICAVCGAKAQWGLLCRKHYRYYDFEGKKLKRIIDRESRWRKEIKK